MPHFHSYRHVPVRLLLLIVFLAFFFVFILQTLIDKTATTVAISQWTHLYFFYHLSHLGLQGVLEPISAITGQEAGCTPDRSP